jgi:signal transduction histidine kinase/DNA-binding response OmpR family regulator
MAQNGSNAFGSVLVVDDERSILDVLEQFLSQRGYRVATAETAEEALRRIGAERFDVALIDLKLPDRTGLDLLEPASRANPDMMCIIMTAFASLESTIEALRHNAFDYIVKPFDLLKVGEVVDAASAHARFKRENSEVLERLEAANRRLEDNTKALSGELLRINEELSKANESLNRHVTRLRVLYQMGRDISSNENWSDALDRFFMALCKYLEAEGAGLLLFSNNEQALKVRTSYQLENSFLDEAMRRLAAAQNADTLPSEIFSLESCSGDRAKTCLEMTARWDKTVAPLLYKGRWLGFLLIAKVYRSRRAYLGDYHFINTIQTILTEEVANAVNISRLRSLKNFNETVLEHINSGVLTTDSVGKVIFLNERAREIIGDRARLGVAFDELFTNPYGRNGLFAHLLSRVDQSSSFESLLMQAAGRSIPVRLNTTAVKLDEHHGPTVIVIFEDLAAQKQMEEELRRADRLRSLGELSAGVAHEIRNPLTGIATTAQVLKEKLAGDAGNAAYLKVILEEIARLDDIIKNLLNFARPVSPNPTEVSLSGLIEDALALLIDRAREQRVSLHFESRLIDDRCLLDGDQIKQVILNIVLNGIQACDGGGTASVYLREAANPAFIEIELTDTGTGVPDEIADKLYNPFFTTRPEGTGMGLPISRKIVESHGGRIRHRSSVGTGTSFFVELPRKTLVTSQRVPARAPE